MSGRYGCGECGIAFAELDDLAEHDHGTHGEPSRYVVDADPMSLLRNELASYLHGDECTCPYSIEAEDLERADQWLRVIDAARVDDTAARSKASLDAEELDPGSPWNIAGVDR